MTLDAFVWDGIKDAEDTEGSEELKSLLMQSGVGVEFELVDFDYKIVDGVKIMVLNEVKLLNVSFTNNIVNPEYARYSEKRINEFKEYLGIE